MIHGRGEEVGAALVRHKDVQLVSFTGSAAVGREIASACGQNLKRVSLELGGKNAQIVMEDADLDLAIEGALWGAFGTTGQRCTATSRLIVHRDVAKKVTDALVERAQKIKIGDGLDESVEMGPLINQTAREKVMRYIEIGSPRRRAATHRRGNLRFRRLRQWLLFPTDDFRSGEAPYAYRAGRDFRAGAVDY